MKTLIQQSKVVEEMDDKSLNLDTAAARMESVVLESGVEKQHVKSALAKVCGIKVQSIHGWFNGTTKNPLAAHIAAVAVHYKADAVWIITGTRATGVTATYSETLHYPSAHAPNLQEEEIHCKEVIIRRVYKR